MAATKLQHGFEGIVKVLQVFQVKSCVDKADKMRENTLAANIVESVIKDMLMGAFLTVCRPYQLVVYKSDLALLCSGPGTHTYVVQIYPHKKIRI